MRISFSIKCRPEGTSDPKAVDYQPGYERFQPSVLYTVSEEVSIQDYGALQLNNSRK